MQTNRLFEIIYLLLSHQTMTAKELSEHFEVSKRTIYRDIEALSGAGIPVYMCQGRGGGIRLLDNYILNRAVLSEEEQKAILSALQGLEATTGTRGEALLTKLTGMFRQQNESWIEIDYSDWGGMGQEKFDSIKQAILSHNVITFEYYGTNGQKSIRKVQPTKLYFRDRTWYLRGYCLMRKAMCLFKLRRMKKVVTTQETFERSSEMDAEKKVTNEVMASDSLQTKIVFEVDATQGYRIYDEFDDEEIHKNEDGSFLITVNYPIDDWVYGMLLSFGSHLQVLEPKFIRDRIGQELTLMSKLYQS